MSTCSTVTMYSRHTPFKEYPLWRLNTTAGILMEKVFFRTDSEKTKKEEDDVIENITYLKPTIAVYLPIRYESLSITRGKSDPGIISHMDMERHYA